MALATRASERSSTRLHSLIEGRFKIVEDGYNNGVWGTEIVIRNAGKQVIKIPSCIADGDYLLRAELIALHGAGNAKGAQLYVGHIVSSGSPPLTRSRWSVPRFA